MYAKSALRLLKNAMVDYLDIQDIEEAGDLGIYLSSARRRADLERYVGGWVEIYVGWDEEAECDFVVGEILSNYDKAVLEASDGWVERDPRFCEDQRAWECS